MTSMIEQRSARIYQFPVGGRAALGGQRVNAEAAVNVPLAAIGAGAWYHEEAILEAERARRSVRRFPGT